MPAYKGKQQGNSYSIPNEIWDSAKIDGLPILDTKTPEKITVEYSIDNLTDTDLASELQRAASSQIYALDVLGRLESKVSYLEHVVTREIDMGVQDLMVNDPSTSKQLGSGRTSFSSLRGYVMANNEDLRGLDDELAKAKALLILIKREAEALTVHRETLSRQVTIRLMEVDKGMRG